MLPVNDRYYKSLSWQWNGTNQSKKHRLASHPMVSNQKQFLLTTCRTCIKQLQSFAKTQSEYLHFVIKAKGEWVDCIYGTRGFIQPVWLKKSSCAYCIWTGIKRCWYTAARQLMNFISYFQFNSKQLYCTMIKRLTVIYHIEIIAMIKAVLH